MVREDKGRPPSLGEMAQRSRELGRQKAREVDEKFKDLKKGDYVLVPRLICEGPVPRDFSLSTFLSPQSLNSFNATIRLIDE